MLCKCAEHAAVGLVLQPQMVYHLKTVSLYLGVNPGASTEAGRFQSRLLLPLVGLRGGRGDTETKKINHFIMAFSLISRHGKGLILPNQTESSELNADKEGDDTIKDTVGFLDREEEEIRFKDKHQDRISMLGNTGTSKNICPHWTTGDITELFQKDTDKDTGEDKNGKWYTFLQDLYNKFSEYEIQKERQRYNVADLEDWGHPGKPQGIFVTPKTFKKFLDKIKTYNVSEYETIKNLNTTTSLQIKELDEVLNLTLKHKPTVRCSEPDVTIKGSFISLNETMHNIISNLDTNNSCKDFKAQLSAGKYDLFEVFAFNKVFIDADLSFSGKKISVAIIAPKWEVVGSRSIELSGSDGTPYAQPTAENGKHPGNDGENGSPGNPGVSGESFFGIGATFVGGEKLKVTSNGGKGGNGQNGGNGAPGMPGKDAEKPSTHDPSCKNGYFREFKCKPTGNQHLNTGGSITDETTFHIYGISGGNGGNGGDGGKSGKGGDPGNISITELRHSSSIKKFASKGDEGKSGKAGDKGKGAKNGNDVTGEYEKIMIMRCFFNCRSESWNRIKTEQNNGKGADGKSGTDGKNSKGIKDPIPAKGISKKPYVINQYKIYALENMNNRYQQCTLIQFLDLLNSNNDVRKLYDIFSLIDEFLGLENQFPKLHEHLNFSHFYSSYLERIHSFAKGHKDIPKSNEIKKVLNYLYTTTLGRIYNLRENSDQNLIIDIRGYLDLVKKNTETLKDIEKLNNKVEVVSNYKENYKKNIDQKIEEAKSLIKNQITPEIENINKEIDEQVKSLIEETIALQKQAVKDWKELAKKKEQLEKAIATKGIFNCFKLIGGVVSTLGPAGEIAGTVLDVTSSVGESLALEDQEKILSIPSDVETSLTTLKDQIETMRDEKVSYLNKVLDNLSEEIKKNPKKLGDMKSKIKDIKKKLDDVSEGKLNYKQVSVMEKELEGSIKSKGVELKTHSKDKESVSALEAIDKISQVINLGSLFSTMYTEMKDDKEKMDTINNSIDEMGDKIILLREYEKSIYETIAPMLQEMGDHMKDISAKLGTKSHVALDVTKWKVQSTLKNMKVQMEQLTKDHDEKDDIIRSIEKLGDVMTTLINVYDRMQSYQDQETLANYIADISSVAASSINIKDQHLVNATNHLEFAIRANIVLEQYKSAIDALKQWVFPFSDRYIEKSMLPSQLVLNDSIENLVDTVTKRIETTKQKIDLYETSIKNGDQYLECEEFTSRYVSSQPFFVWKNEEHREPISSVLSGNEILLKADVKDSVPHKDAIKFSEINFEFKTRNTTAQSILDKILKGFDIRATHLGNSYYRYNDKISLITSSSVTISYSYEKNDDGIPIRSNEVYSRLKSGDLLLSPYTLWEIKLVKKTDKYSFKDFEKYKNEINIEMSGLGSYVDTSEINIVSNRSLTMENNDILTIFEPKRTGLHECKRSKYDSSTSVNRSVVEDFATKEDSKGMSSPIRSKYRSARSVHRNLEDGDFVTSGASKDMPSPINFLFSFFKTYFISNLVISINKVFFKEKTPLKYEFTDFTDGCAETRKAGSNVESKQSNNRVNSRKTDAKYSYNDCTKEKIKKKSDIKIDFNFNDSNLHTNSLLLNDVKDRSNNHLIQVPDLNCSLLLADLVTRTITRNRYNSSFDEHFLPPREVVLSRKISDIVVQNESDVKEMLHLHQLEKEKIPSFWYNYLNSYAKSMLNFLGLMRIGETEEYVQDLRHLFA